MMPVPGNSEVTQRQADAPAAVCISPLPPNRAVIQTEEGKEVVMVPPAPFEVLQVLAERPGRDYSFSEILQQILPGKEPTEPSLGINKEMLAARITKLRKALNPACRRLLADPSYDCIENTRSYGYRLNATRGPLRTERIFDAFHKAPISLREKIKLDAFEVLVDERTEDFVGRQYIVDEVDSLLADSRFTSGYVVIRGEPGIGKTALIAHLIKERKYVHHFNVAAQGINSPSDFLASTCAQLIVWYGLPYRALPQEAIKDSGFLSQLLAEAVARAGDQHVVVLIDALDEAEDIGLRPKANRLYLPPVLPTNVFFIITAREEVDIRLHVDRRKDINLRDNDPKNLEDVRQYIQEYLRRHSEQLAVRIAEWRITEAEFLTVMTDKSQGNFMYLVYVLRDIRNGKLTAATIDNVRHLPHGLQGYYQRHWRTMRAQDKERFDEYQLPVVCLLATVKEPVGIPQLMEWTRRPPWNIKEPWQIKAVIDEWREFLNMVEDKDGKPRYHIYHTSFQDFLKEEVGLAVYDYAIAQTALDKITGFRDAPEAEIH